MDEVADVMVRGRVHRVLVTRNGKVAGIISALDLVRALRDLVREKAE
jgi:CBS domain-containing protein